MAGSEGISQVKRDLIHLNGFELCQMIGRGAFSDVYRATNTETQEVIAIKCFRHEMKNFRRYQFAATEIAFLRMLQHPNIVQLKVFELNEWTTSGFSFRFVFIGTEYAAFGSLARFLVPKKPLSEGLIQVIMRQVLSALDYMHSLGVIHGDVKPDNILCTDITMNKPTVKLCDFGLSEIILKGQKFTFNSGSALFMAPEVHFKLHVDVTSDIWSAGVVMYNMMFCRSLYGFEQKDLAKHVEHLRRKTPLNFDGSENYSEQCNALLKQFLRYRKSYRIQGEALRKHPFVNLETPANSQNEFLDKARSHITHAETLSKNKIFGKGLVEGIQALNELKIHHNSLEEKEQRDKVLQMMAQYQLIISKLESHLLQPPETKEADLSNEDFKKHLESKPSLLSGFEIGCIAEMYEIEKNYSKALQLFHQALQTLLPLMKQEPKSYLKEMLGRKMVDLADISDAKRDLIIHMNGFELNEMIGRGSFADVFKATNKETKEVIALKYYRQEMKNFRRFQFAATEIAFMRVLHHPNIVQLKVFEVNLHFRFVLIGTEYAAFGSLERFLVPKKPLSEALIQVVMRQVLAALDYMHSLGVIHGDVKPENILCSELNMNMPTVKLCDFGLAEIILKGEKFKFNSGTALFMAPEVHFKLLVDVTSDLWSVGVVMYKMMFSESLFGFDAKDFEKHIDHLRDKTPLDFSGSENYSENCNDLLNRLLRYQKRYRIQGEALRKHPFVKLEKPRHDEKEFLDNARRHIAHAETLSNNKIFGKGLVEGIQALIELKMYHNSLEEKEKQDELQQMLGEYKITVASMESHLVQPPETRDANTEDGLSDEDFKKHLTSTPSLLTGFKIGCSAEIYKTQENYPKALKLFHQALGTMLPLIKTQPKSYIKEMLGRKLFKWIQEAENLKKMLSPGPSHEVGSSSCAPKV